MNSRLPNCSDGVVFLIPAIVLPVLVAHAVAPAATVLNQLLAMAAWGVGLLSLSAWRVCTLHAAWPLITVTGFLSLTAIVSPAPTPLTQPAWLTALGALALAVAACSSTALKTTQQLAIGFVVLGAVNAIIALVQVFLPALADGIFIARSGLEGRAVGNLRQPNHLSTLALWSAVAAVPLFEWTQRWRWAFALLFACSIVTVELTASRTGMVGVAVLALWGLLDRRLSLATRLLLVGGAAVYVLAYFGQSWWAHAHQHTAGVEARLQERDLSASRFGIWKNTLSLIQANPWTGVGFGEFNFAWTLSPFPDRPTAFFDHTHNIVLQLIVELGIPLGGLIVVLLFIAFWQAFRRATSVQDERGVGFRAAFVMVLLIGIHSLLEYPLWYAYFLLPTAWLWGLCLGASNEPEPVDAPPPSFVARAFPVVAGSLMIAGSAVAFQQYLGVSRIFEPGTDTRPLSVRIAEGQRSIFFGHHAHYAAATVAENPAEAWDAFRVAPHFLLDTRLMIAWADAFAARGDLDRARHIAARLREFRRPESKEYFAACDAPVVPGASKPYQCEPPSRVIDWREFRDPALWAK